MAVAAGLWVFAVLLWIILIYTFFAAVTVVEPKPSIEVAISGSWLLVTVATEWHPGCSDAWTDNSNPIWGALRVFAGRDVLYAVDRLDLLSLDLS